MLFRSFKAESHTWLPVTTTRTQAKKKDTITIHISGAVHNPGVYTFEKGIRAMDAINHIGGVQSRADLDQINLAQKLKDGKRLRIPHRASIAVYTPDRSNKIALNTCTKEVLISLPGIGPKTAAAIVAYRHENGPFQDITELLKIKGIGKKKLKRIQAYIEL